MVEEKAWLCSSDVKKRTIAGEAFLITVRSNRLLVINKQATSIWNQLERSVSRRASDIVELLKVEYPNAPVERLQIDTHNFLLDLEKRGFVHQIGKNLEMISFHDQKFNVSDHFSFSERFHQFATSSNIPISGGLEITQRCHLRCLHCYIDNQPVSCGNELSTKEACSLLDEMAKQGCLWLLITGGEPLLREDFSEIYLYAKNLGMIVTIFTSATNLSKKHADLFAKYPPFLVEATLHGVEEATFDGISRVPGSFKGFIRGIALLRELNVSFHLKMIVMKQNVYEVEAARRLAIDLGAGDFRFDPMINADFLHSSKAFDLRLSVDEAVKLDLLEPYKTRWQKIFQAAITEQEKKPFLNGLLFPCRAGRSSFSISSDGQLLPCILIRSPSYDLKKGSFIDAWQRLNYYTTSVRMREDNPCFNCPTKTCSKCPAWGYLEHGSPDVKSGFACNLQKEREKFFLQ